MGLDEANAQLLLQKQKVLASWIAVAKGLHRACGSKTRKPLGDPAQKLKGLLQAKNRTLRIVPSSVTTECSLGLNHPPAWLEDPSAVHAALSQTPYKHFLSDAQCCIALTGDTTAPRCFIRLAPRHRAKMKKSVLYHRTFSAAIIRTIQVSSLLNFFPSVKVLQNY